MRQVVVDKSIQRRRIVYKTTGGLIFDYLIMYLLAWGLPILSVKLIFFSTNNRFSPIEAIYILIDLWFLIGIYLMNKLVVCKGHTFEENKNVVMLVLKEQYPDMIFTSGNANLIRGKKEVGYLRDRIITILLDENDIYINILNTYRGEGFSFFHGLTNYFKSKSLSKEISLSVSSYNSLTS